MRLKKILAMMLLAALVVSAAMAESAIITENTRVYKEASKSSASVHVSKGTEIDLVEINGGWATVERSGIRAYMNKDQVETIPEDPDFDELMKNAQPAKITTGTRVYKKASTASASIRVNKGLEVNLLSAKDGWAIIENNGVYAYIKSKHVKLVKAEENEYEAKPAVITADTRVYKKASTSSASLRVNKGMQVNLLATNGSWAMVENNGTRAYMKKEYIELRSEADEPVVTPTPEPTAKPTPVPTATPAPVADNYFDSDKYSNEEKCYIFLTREMGLNTAAACGILANLKKESSFNPTAGSSYYGLVQWGGGRKSNLQSFCSKNGYSYSTLEGQLNFLEYELKNSYPSILEYLQSVPNTSKGAYDAAYHFCYYYERPSNKASKSASRGELARDTYFAKYA